MDAEPVFNIHLVFVWNVLTRDMNDLGSSPGRGYCIFFDKFSKQETWQSAGAGGIVFAGQLDNKQTEIIYLKTWQNDRMTTRQPRSQGFFLLRKKPWERG